MALLLFVVAFLLYNLNGRVITAGDCLPARFLPFAVLEHGTLRLDSVVEATRQGLSRTYWIVRSRDGHFASMYPVVAPLLVTPLYLPAWIYLARKGWTEERLANVGLLMEKVSASVVASLSAMLFFLLVRRRIAQRNALLLAVLFAFGTNTWVTGSQALWQHGVGELLVIVALLAATGPPSWRNVLLLGLAIGLLPGNRPPDVVLACGFAVYALFWAKRRCVAVAGAAVVPAGLVAAYNFSVFGTLAGGYQAGGVGTQFFSGSVIVGIAGLLVSPGKGLFVFSPFLLFLPILFRRTTADVGQRLLTWCLVGAVTLQIGLYAMTDWRAGYSWGPRFLTDLLPIVLWMLAPILESLSGLSLRLFLMAGVFAILVQAIGAFFYQGRSDILMYHGPGADKTRAWRIENTPYWAELQPGLAKMTLLKVVGVSDEMQQPANWLRAIGSSR